MKQQRKRTMSGEQASEDAIVPNPPNNAHSTTEDLDHERPGGMSGGLGDTDPDVAPRQKRGARSIIARP